MEQLKNKVISLSIAKKMYELDFMQDSCFYHFVYPKNPMLNIWDEESEVGFLGNIEQKKEYESNPYNNAKNHLYSAFMVSELEWVLPKKIILDSDEYKLVINKFRENGDKWNIQYINNNGMIIGKISKDKKLVDAMAFKIIELLEGNFIKLIK